MKEFLLIWATVQFALLIAGILWIITDKKRGRPTNKTPYILMVVGVLMIVAFCFLLLPLRNK